ncbi:hypothetical protein LEA_16937, partial [human gut metagenome]
VKWTGQPIDVTLKDDTQQLGEVVVTALGLKREEKALGYAVTEVKGDELKAANTISPVAALQGKVAVLKSQAQMVVYLVVPRYRFVELQP